METWTRLYRKGYTFCKFHKKFECCGLIQPTSTFILIFVDWEWKSKVSSTGSSMRVILCLFWRIVIGRSMSVLSFQFSMLTKLHTCHRGEAQQPFLRSHTKLMTKNCVIRHFFFWLYVSDRDRYKHCTK